MTEQRGPAQKPVPLPDEQSQPFFDGAARGVLMIRGCQACGARLAPTIETCTECLGDDLAWVQASGRGTLFTFAIMHRLYHPAFADDIPYNLAMVELEEGPRLQSNIVGVANHELTVGMALEVTFDQVAKGVSLPRFRPAGA